MTADERIEKAFNKIKEPIFKETVSDGNYIPASTIAGILIENVGRFCEKHAADFLLDWGRIEKTIENFADIQEETAKYIAIGIRELGVDSNDLIHTRLSDTTNPYETAQHYYRKIFIVEIARKKDKFFDQYNTIATLVEAKSVIE